jgi:uncharacterized protein
VATAPPGAANDACRLALAMTSLRAGDWSAGSRSGSLDDVLDRDRDALGRPRNARPRDELGGPLSRNDTGTAGVLGDVVLEPSEALLEAQRLPDQGRPFHAHEVLEAAWKAAPVDQRNLWKGLAQLAVGVTHARRGNRVGAVALLRRGADLIGTYADEPPYGIDVREYRGREYCGSINS